MDLATTLETLSQDLSLQQKEAIRKELSAYLNHLLLHDFSTLVQILYQVDVSEEKIKQLLAQNKEADAGDLLAELIIERQLQKQAFKQASPPAEDIPDEERW